MLRLVRLLFYLGLAVFAATAEEPFHSAEFIFPLEAWHNHGSSLVELPDGDIFAVWYHGSRERRSDDVLIEAARLPKGSSQ